MNKEQKQIRDEIMDSLIGWSYNDLQNTLGTVAAKNVYYWKNEELATWLDQDDAEEAAAAQNASKTTT